MKFMEKNMVKLHADIRSAEEAIRLSGDLLVTAGAVLPRYIDAMLSSYQKNGPYIVIAPSIALPHARPEDGALIPSVSFVQLGRPIPFGHQSNDPVDLVFAIGASSDNDHIRVLQKLSQLLSDSGSVHKLRSAKDYEDVKELLEVIKI